VLNAMQRIAEFHMSYSTHQQMHVLHIFNSNISSDNQTISMTLVW